MTCFKSSSCVHSSFRTKLPCEFPRRIATRCGGSSEFCKSDGTDAFTHWLRKCRTRHRFRVQAGIVQYLKDPTISPILTSTLIAAGTVSFNLVAGLVTEKKRADLQLEVQRVLPICWLLNLTSLAPKPTLRLCRLSNSETLRKLSKNCNH